MRRQKDRANLFAASGDDDGRRAAQKKINLLTRKYKQFSDAAGLPTKKERMRVAKFHSVKTAAELKRNKLHSIKSHTSIKFSVSHGKDATVAQVYKSYKSEFAKYQTQFGSVDYVTQVLLSDYTGDGTWGSFDDDSGIITIAGANGANGFKDLTKTAKKMFLDGEWSSASELHTFRHELTHAWLLQRKSDPDFLKRLYAVYDYRRSLLNDLTSFSDSDRIVKKKELLSLYGLKEYTEPDDFICECFAEYLNGGPREVSKKVVDMLIKG